MPDYKISKREFELFKREVLKWIREFGLKEYDVEVIMERLKNENATANTQWSIGGRWSTITLAPIWHHKPLPGELKRTAFHEVVHLLLAPIVHEGGCRYTHQDTLNEVEEGVVVRLENFFRHFIMHEKL